MKPDMTRRTYLLIAAAFIVLAAVFILAQAPPSTPITAVPCLRRDDACIRFPAVSGISIDNVEVALPADFTGEYRLVVMPFDREQQTRAIEWLPLFREIAAEQQGLTYYSVAALPDLAPAVKLLVLGGLSAGVTDAEVRAVTFVLFLQDQAAFAAALNISDLEQMTVLLLNREGEVLFQLSGDFDEEKASRLRMELENISK